MTGMFLIGLAIAATGLELTPPTSAASQVAAERAARDTRVICRREDQIGTRLAPRICLTRAQWTQRDKEARISAREGMDENARAGANRTTPAGGD
jgi:hypothetical protein